jgi:hypothetical protein
MRHDFPPFWRKGVVACFRTEPRTDVVLCGPPDADGEVPVSWQTSDGSSDCARVHPHDLEEVDCAATRGVLLEYVREMFADPTARLHLDAAGWVVVGDAYGPAVYGRGTTEFSALFQAIFAGHAWWSASLEGRRALARLHPRVCS